MAEKKIQTVVLRDGEQPACLENYSVNAVSLLHVYLIVSVAFSHFDKNVTAAAAAEFNPPSGW